jgi:maltose-binding protein MalE
MPVVPEMRALWDVMRPGMQRVVSGSASPDEAAREMQEDAVRKIEEMKM